MLCPAVKPVEQNVDRLLLLPSVLSKQRLSQAFSQASSASPKTQGTLFFLLCILFLHELIGTLCITHAEIIRFKDPHPHGGVIEYWRITHDPAIREHANYHNTNCWSQDGRYICYTRYLKRKNEIHIVDLRSGEDSYIGNGSTPRWAKKNNWLFYARRNRDAGDPWERGTEVMRYEIDTGGKELVTWGMEFLGSTDHQDRWIYGNQRLGFLKGKKWFTARAPTAPLSEIEIIYKNTRAKRPLCNPTHDIISIRFRDLHNDFGPSRVWLDLDGSNERTGVSMIQDAHYSWSGDGEYQLIGNYQARGRRWDEPFPSNIHLLANIHFGDISPCGRSGRWICGDYGVADLRSGEGRRLPRVPSSMSFPVQVGDRSHLYDADPKGSPDGTKICFVSNFDIADECFTRTAKTVTDEKNLPVTSTAGFPISGLLEIHGEVVGYETKTPILFKGITRHVYKTGKYHFLKKGWYVVPLESRLMTKAQKERARNSRKWLSDATDGGPDNPLLRQRQTDVYVSVIRLPDPPHIRRGHNTIEVIPGENHWETFGYRLERNGEILNQEPFTPGTRFEAKRPGTYRAIAVEWSGLHGKPSLPFQLAGPEVFTVLQEKPEDFTWTNEIWSVNGKHVSEAEAHRSDHSTKEVRHIHDGLIQRQYYVDGHVRRSEDLASNGTVIRQIIFQNGKMSNRRYFSSDGKPVSLERFAGDGFKTEEILWSTRCKKRDGNPKILHHWFYDKGFPVKHIADGGKVVREKKGSRWLRTE